jgi:hypothetical protein
MKHRKQFESECEILQSKSICKFPLLHFCIGCIFHFSFFIFFLPFHRPVIFSVLVRMMCEIEISNLFHYHFLSAGSSHNEKKKEAILRMSRLYYYLNIVNNHKLNALNVEQFYCWTF